MTEIYLIRKKSKVYPQLKKFAAKLKAEKNPIQRIKNNNQDEYNSTICKRWIQIKEI